MCDSGICAVYIWGTFHLIVFKVIWVHSVYLFNDNNMLYCNHMVELYKIHMHITFGKNTHM